MQINVAVTDANNIVCEVVPPQTQTITIDRGVAGNGIVSIVPVTISTFQYLRITYTNGTVQDVGPLTSTAYTATAPITIVGNTISLATVPIASGGTDATTAAGAIQNLLPLYTGNANKRLGLNSLGTALEWVADGGGTVTSVAASGGTTGLSFTGSPITSSGTLTLGGTLGIANGGTGQVTANAAFNALAPSQTGNSGKYLTTDGSNTSWATNPLGTVTSVAATVPSFLSISGSPITTSGTLAFSLSGTALPTTSGGTGLTSFTANGVVYASSTSALVTGSGLTFDGTNFGVGTTSPSSYGLVVAKKDQTSDTAITVSNAGTASSTTTMSFVLNEAGTAQGWFRRYRDGSANTEIGFSNALLFTGDVTGTKTERARITSTGSFLVGTTNSGLGILNVGGTVSTSVGSGGTFSLSYTTANTSSRSWRIANDVNVYGDFAIQQSTTQTGATFASQFYINNVGSVGIGTSTPAYKFQVVSTANNAAEVTSTASTTALRIDNTNASGWGSNLSIYTGGTAAGYFGTLGSLLGNTTQDLAVWATSGNGIRFYTNGNNERARIDSSGNATFYGNINISATNYVYTGSLGSKLWTPGLAIGTGTYAGLYGPALTYLAERTGSTWTTSGGGTAGALTIDEGYFSFARSTGNAGPGQTITWNTYLNSDGGGNFFFNSVSCTKIASGTTAQRPGTLAAGQLRFNTTLNQFEGSNGSTINKIVTENLITSATGGTITTDGDYKIHTFTSSGTFTVSAISGNAPVQVQVLIVGGGGGGGFYLGGGGGGGAMLETFVNMTGASYTVTVGGGGNAIDSGYTYSSNGGVSSIVGGLVNLYANGGGAGGNGAINDTWGANGSANNNIGCGGGGGSPYGLSLNNGNFSMPLGGPAGWNGSGGGFGTAYTGGFTFNGGGGGGGAQSAGVAPNIGNGPVGAGGYGGSARPSSITGSVVSYGGGGGGGYGSYLANQAISGGSGAGYGVGSATSGATLTATAGSANLGGGGGGGQAYSGYQRGGAGGSGVVIIRYKYQ